MGNDSLNKLLDDMKDLDEKDEGVPVAAPPAPIIQVIETPPPPSVGGRPKKKEEPKEQKLMPDSTWRKPGYFRGALDRIVPTAERVKFYKRDDLGKMQLIPKTYSIKDLETTSDVEEFILRYLVPVFGYGEYEIELINSKGEGTRTAAISVMNPGGQLPAQDSNSVKMVDQLLERIKQLEAKPVSDPLDQLQKMKSMMEMFGQQKGSDPTQMLLLMQMMQPKGPDPELAALKSELSRLRERERMPIPPPMMPPMLPPEPSEKMDVAALVKTIAETSKPQYSLTDLVTLLKPQEKQQQKSVGFPEVMQMIMTAAPLLKDILGISKMNAIEEKIEKMTNNSNRGLRDSLEEWRIIQGLINQNRPASPEGETIWGFLNNLVNNIGPSADAIGGAFAKMRSAQEANRLQAPPQRQSLAAPAKSTEEEGGLELPADIKPYADAITASADDFGLLEHTLKALQFLGKSAAWRSNLVQMLKAAQAAKAGDATAKEDVLDFLSSFIESLAENKLIPREVADKTITAFKTYFDQVIDIVLSKK